MGGVMEYLVGVMQRVKQNVRYQTSDYNSVEERNKSDSKVDLFADDSQPFKKTVQS